MSKRIIWILTSGFMALALVLAACGPAAPTTPTAPSAPTPAAPSAPTSPAAPTQEKPQQEAVKPSSETPKYGGTLRLPLTADITGWDDIVTFGFVAGPTFNLVNEPIWTGDWTKGPAGGYGAKATDWVNAYDVWANHTGAIAESWNWTIDAAKNEGTIVYQIRQGTRFALDPNNEASRLVNGRQVTADDVVFSLQQVVTVPTAFLYKAFPEIRSANVTKTGQWEVSIKLPITGLVTAITHFGSYARTVPPEVVKKYGNMANWRNSVGSGQFILNDYVPGSQAVMVKNPTYWRKDPIGPGKGNQLPYIDGVRFVIIPDLSTRQAALRTGKIDQASPYTYEEAAQMRKTASQLKEAEGPLGGPAFYIYMNTQRAPFNNLKVRRAMLMSVDLLSIKKNINNDLGQILTWPAEKWPGYEDLYLGLDDPEMPESVKELYTYNPTKAKALLAEAGYPNGFKTSVLIAANEVDYFSIIKDMWAKVGIELALDVKDTGTRLAVYNSGNYDLTGQAGGKGPISVFYSMVTMNAGTSAGGSGSQINDPVIRAASEKMRLMYLTDYKGAMKEFKNLMKYVLDQAYVVSRPIYPQTTFWWPWLKNYSGEQMVGYWHGANWATYVWIDENLKKSMGY